MLKNLTFPSKMAALQWASYLTEPLCQVRESFYRLYILEQTCTTKVHQVATATFLILKLVFCTLLTPITAPFGIVMRGIVAVGESKPFIFLKGGKEGKKLPEDKKITLASHNVCYMPAGYSITDGQILPSDTVRMQANLLKVKECNPDILCLYEVADICDASYLSSQLFKEYPFIIPFAGVRAIGPSSMLFIASKYEIVEDSIEFIPFIKGEELTGRGKYSEKGFLSFDLKSEENTFATIISTHLQHSEIPQVPTEEEKRGRQMQLNKISKKVEEKKGHSVIVTGDLNAKEEELENFKDWRRDENVIGKPTWFGDQTCARWMNKTPSDPQVLDYTLIAGTTETISTQLIPTGFETTEFRPAATSDHALLFSTITLNN